MIVLPQHNADAELRAGSEFFACSHLKFILHTLYYNQSALAFQDWQNGKYKMMMMTIVMMSELLCCVTRPLLNVVVVIW